MDRNEYLQLGIFGIAEDKEFHTALGVSTKQIKRQALAEFIISKDLSGRAFARVVDVSPATITKWLYTETQPSIRVVRRIATKFGVTVDYVDSLFTATA